MCERRFAFELQYLFELHEGAKICFLHENILECKINCWVENNSLEPKTICWFSVFSKMLRRQVKKLELYKEKPAVYKSLKLRYSKDFAKWVMGYEVTIKNEPRSLTGLYKARQRFEKVEY